MRETGSQTDVPLPCRVAAFWQCHRPEAATIIDSGDIDEEFDGDGDDDDNDVEDPECNALDGNGTSATDPRPPREEATALGIEHLDDTAFDFDDFELSFENERMSTSDIDSPITWSMRSRRLAMNGLVSDFNVCDHVSEADDDVKSEPGVVDSESEGEEGNPR